MLTKVEVHSFLKDTVVGNWDARVKLTNQLAHLFKNLK